MESLQNPEVHQLNSSVLNVNRTDKLLFKSVRTSLKADRFFKGVRLSFYSVTDFISLVQFFLIFWRRDVPLL